MKNISAIVWDLDKTLYPFNEAFCIASQKALFNMIVELDIGISTEQAKSYANSNYPMKTISKLNKDFGTNIDKAFFCYYNHLDDGFLINSVSFLEEIRKSDVTFAILSHSNRNWTIRALDKMGLLEFIKPEHIMTIEDLSQTEKHNGVEAFKKILERMSIDANQAIMVEDKDKNLKYARQLGMKTVLLTHGDNNQNIKHADIICNTANDFLKYFNEQIKKNHKTPERPESSYLRFRK